MCFWFVILFILFLFINFVVFRFLNDLVLLLVIDLNVLVFRGNSLKKGFIMIFILDGDVELFGSFF